MITLAPGHYYGFPVFSSGNWRLSITVSVGSDEVTLHVTRTIT